MIARWVSGGRLATGLSFDDRAWQYGDGLFETIAVRDGEPRLLDWHLERLAIGCTRLGLQEPPRGIIESDLVMALDVADVDTSFALVKLVVSAGRGPRGYQRRTTGTQAFLAAFGSDPIAPDLYLSGVRVRLCKTRLARQPQLAGIKTLNRLEQVLARSEWSDNSWFEGLTFDTAGMLICGTMSNVFVVRDNSIVTPDLSQAGVAGIMRRQVIEIAHLNGIAVSVRDISRDELEPVDEVFLCNSQMGVVPVGDLDGRSLAVGSMTRRLMSLLADDGLGKPKC